MKISVITATGDHAKNIIRAIESIIEQDYDNYEHIIVDNSPEGCLSPACSQYPNLKLIPEPGCRKYKALQKGFKITDGQVIAFLDPDDYYRKGTFKALIPSFADGKEVIAGRIVLKEEKAGDRGISCAGPMQKQLFDKATSWLKNKAGQLRYLSLGKSEDGGNKEEKFKEPKASLMSLIRNWEDDASSRLTTYFFRRDLAEEILLHDKMVSDDDLEFIIKAASRSSIQKLDHITTVSAPGLSSGEKQPEGNLDYWREDNFSYINEIASGMAEDDQKSFFLDRDRGYQYRRQCAVQKALDMGIERELFESGKVFSLPEDVDEAMVARSGFIEHDRLATENDWIIPVLTMGKVASKSICHTLKSLPDQCLPAQVYHVHQMNRPMIKNRLPGNLPSGTNTAVGLALADLLAGHEARLTWKFIAGVREPISYGLSMYYQRYQSDPEKIKHADRYIKNEININPFMNHFANQYEKVFGFNIYDYEFDHHKKYLVIKKDNIEVLIYRLEDLPVIFTAAMEEYLGIGGLKLASVNISTNKAYAESYKKVKEKVRFSREFLDQVYSSKQVRYFYSAEEIEGFYKKWLDDGNSNPVYPSPAPVRVKKQVFNHSSSLLKEKNSASPALIKKDRYYKPFNPHYPVLSIHIPKTAGQAFEEILRKWYKNQLFLHYPDISVKQARDLSLLRPGQCVHGHFNKRKGFGVEDFAGDKPENQANVITIIRNPFNMIVSLFLYLKYKSPDAVVKKRPQEFEKFFNGFLNKKHYLFNYLLNHEQENNNDLESYLKKYTFIGVQEDLEKSILLLSKILGFQPVKLPKKNVSDYSKDNIPNLEPLAREVYKDEYLFYDHVSEIIKACNPD